MNRFGAHGRGHLALAGVLALMGLAAAFPTCAGAYVYWSSGTLYRANLDGSGVNEKFLADNDARIGVAVGGEHVFWSETGGTIGRANLDGSDPEPNFITGASIPYNLAVDGQHLYWANYGGTSIGRANLDGTAVEEKFVTVPSGTTGVAVDGQHVYWSGGNKIGRANLDGSAPDGAFMTTSSEAATSVAVDARHVYWSNFKGGSIGRANLDGSDPEESFITGADEPLSVAVDDQHVYWGNFGSGTIGRAAIDGSAPEPGFIKNAGVVFGVAVDSLPHSDAATLGCKPAKAILGGSATCTVTVNDTGPFSASSGGLFSKGTISLTASGGGGFEPAPSSVLTPTATAGVAACQVSFKPTAIGTQTIAATYPGDTFHVNPASASTTLEVKPQNAFKLGKPKLNRHTGGAVLVATLPGPGRLALKGKGIKSEKVKVAKAGKARLVVRPTGKLAATLKAVGKAKAKLRVTFTPSGGDPKSKSLSLRLARAG
jgi:hypothetical protein